MITEFCDNILICLSKYTDNQKELSGIVKHAPKSSHKKNMPFTCPKIDSKIWFHIDAPNLAQKYGELLTPQI